MFVVKTAHALYPKYFITEALTGAPGGAHIVLTAKDVKTGVDMVAVGYKYSAKTILHFIATADAADTRSGKAYTMKYSNENGNVCYHYVPRPRMVERYLAASNANDIINQQQQGFLRLEKNGRLLIHTSD